MSLEETEQGGIERLIAYEAQMEYPNAREALVLEETARGLLDQFGDSVKGEDGETYTTIKPFIQRRIDGEMHLFGLRSVRSSDKVFGEADDFISLTTVMPGGSLTDVAELRKGLLRVQVPNEEVQVNLLKDITFTSGLVKDMKKDFTDRLAQEELEQARTRSRRIDFLKTMSLRGTVGLAGLAVVSGLVWGIKAIDWSDTFKSSTDKFDEHRYTLADPKTSGFGEVVSPANSTELRDKKALRASEIPTFAGDAYDDEDIETTTGDSTLTQSDGLRQIIFNTSNDNTFKTKDEKKPNCETVDIEEGTSSNAILHSWTDFVGPDGTSRADELTITLEPALIKACWSGVERNDDDDPRIVFDIVTPS